MEDLNNFPREKHTSQASLKRTHLIIAGVAFGIIVVIGVLLFFVYKDTPEETSTPTNTQTNTPSTPDATATNTPSATTSDTQSATGTIATSSEFAPTTDADATELQEILNNMSESIQTIETIGQDAEAVGDGESL